MANWKKMAEAFGRALGRPDIRNEMNTFGKNSKQGVKDRQELFDTMHRSAVNNDAEDEFMTGLTFAEDDNTKIARRTGNRDMAYDERQREFDKLTDDRMDDELVRSMFEKVTAKVSPELRAQAIEMLQRGESIPDVLDILSRGY